MKEAEKVKHAMKKSKEMVKESGMKKEKKKEELMSMKLKARAHKKEMKSKKSK